MALQSKLGKERFRRFHGAGRMLLMVAIVAGLCTPLVAQAPAATQKPPATAPKEAPPASSPKSATCPDGSTPVHRQTLFGSIDVCGAPAAPPASAPPNAQAPVPGAAPTNTPVSNKPSPESGKPLTPAPAGVVAPASQPPTAQSNAPSATPPAEPKSESQTPSSAGAETAVSLNLENADLYQVLRIIAGELKINYIVDPAVKGTVTINTSVSVTRKELFSLLQMILEINGAAAVKSNGYYAIVPLGAAKQQPLNFHFEKEAEGTPKAEDAFSLLVVPLKFISAAEISKVLTPFMSSAGQIVVQDKGNLMLIVESAAKLEQLKHIIDVFDDPVLGRQRVRLFPVANNLAKNLVGDLKSVFAGYGLSTGSPAIQFIPMEYQNSILAISASPEVFPEVESWIKKLDQPSAEVGIRNFVYKVQNAKASDLANILSQLYGGGVETPGTTSAGTTPTLTGAASPLNPATVMGPQFGGTASQAAAAVSGVAAHGSQLSGNLRIIADDKNNAVIIQSTPHDYDILEQTLRQLDVLPRQVLIDAKMYEVNLTGDLSLGLSAFLDKQNNLQPITNSGSFSAASGLAAQTFAILHNTYELQLFLTASENRSRVKTLSAPSILVTDNTTARIQVGSEVPVPIGSALTPVQSGGNSIFAQTIQFRDTGVILNVTPRINASGIVTLQIGQEVSSAQPNTTSAIVAPVISKSEFNTTVVLQDGQTLALGGIITTSSNNSRQRVPLIGDIPGLGLLFGNTSLSTSRKELVLMITPHVSADMNQAGNVSGDFLRQMRDLKKDLRKIAPVAGGQQDAVPRQ